ncbi:sugar phosphate nucleotidyltransferase [Desulfogranum mediterraneum]|uniref:sugar phosphate nucleotidyltransferase n=1 Tax=Desulfogranum mediterraneum TaxID=160661 RepID=UPI0003F55311|nr:sugar phosphate nucleotidyltransferase [Desulfogranum mediterraneum]
MAKLIGLIPAAGKGVRARPYTTLVPKGMLQVDGRPNLERIICLMRDQLGIDEIYMTVGYLSGVIKAYFGDGVWLGVRLHYIDNSELDKGLAWSILLAGRELAAPCCVMLSDECYVGSNHQDLLDFAYEDALATCTVMDADDTKLIQRNYSVHKEGDRVLNLVEKPEVPENNLLGLGTFLLTPAFFPLLEEAFARAPSGYVEFVTFLDQLCGVEPGVLCYELKGTYVNINDRDSLNLARFYERRMHFSENRISLLLYSEGVEENIDFTINRYRRNPQLDTISVVMPQANTIADKVRGCGAEVILCPREVELYGEKIRYGLARTGGDIIVMAEADYTFPEHDICKLLEYIKEADMVVGTRTTRQLIEQGSDMRGLVRLANIVLAKFIELLWWKREVRISDVGCTFRAIWRSCYEDLQDRLEAKGPELLAEMAVEMLRDRKRLIEIPVSYYNRSEAMFVKYRNRKTFVRILVMIAAKRFKGLLRS